MIGDIRIHLERFPFVPFTVPMADGRSFYIPTPDHISISGGRAIVTIDSNDYDILPGLLMTGLKVNASMGAAELP